MRNENLGGFLSQHFRAVMIGVGVVILLCILALIGLGVSKIKPAHTLLEIAVAPHDATISINGQEYRNGIYEFEPGNYTVDISAEGFTNKTMNITVEKGQTANVNTFLPNENEGISYFEKSTTDISILRNIDEPEVQEFIQLYDKKISIKNQLPFDVMYDEADVIGSPGSAYAIQTADDGSKDSRCQMAFCILITGDGFDEVSLQEAFEDRGYNLDDYEVIYDF